MSDVRKPPACFSRFTKQAILQMILHVPPRNLRKRFEQSRRHMTLCKICLHKWNYENLQRSLTSHGHPAAECKTFDRHRSTKQQQSAFFRNMRIFLIRNKSSIVSMCKKVRNTGSPQQTDAESIEFIGGIKFILYSSERELVIILNHPDDSLRNLRRK